MDSPKEIEKKSTPEVVLEDKGSRIAFTAVKELCEKRERERE